MSFFSFREIFLSRELCSKIKVTNQYRRNYIVKRMEIEYFYLYKLISFSDLRESASLTSVPTTLLKLRFSKKSEEHFGKPSHLPLLSLTISNIVAHKTHINIYVITKSRAYVYLASESRPKVVIFHRSLFILSTLITS